MMGLNCSGSARQHENMNCPQAEVWEVELVSGAVLGQGGGISLLGGF